MGLSGTHYPAIAISEVKKLNYHYAFKEVSLESLDHLEEWIDQFLEGKLSPNIVSQSMDEAYQLGEFH